MDDQQPLSRKIIAFVLTLIALPILFTATCVPVGLFAGGATGGSSVMAAVISFIALFTAAAIGVAIRTKNPGIRWGIVVYLVLAVFAAVWWAITVVIH